MASRRAAFDLPKMAATKAGKIQGPPPPWASTQLPARNPENGAAREQFSAALPGARELCACCAVPRCGSGRLFGQAPEPGNTRGPRLCHKQDGGSSSGQPPSQEGRRNTGTTAHPPSPAFSSRLPARDPEHQLARSPVLPPCGHSAVLQLCPAPGPEEPRAWSWVLVPECGHCPGAPVRFRAPGRVRAMAGPPAGLGSRKTPSAACLTGAGPACPCSASARPAPPSGSRAALWERGERHRVRFDRAELSRRAESKQLHPVIAELCRLDPSVAEEPKTPEDF
ncbi:uncharacterized protein LOC134550499 isoform X1 [Prinia subflava]|uniref:uncharacterized protein LOC134550499 isoform X1 n=1 Tax=Prinia subflava TaxID=208062 RepID=UPI002FDF344C